MDESPQFTPPRKSETSSDNAMAVQDHQEDKAVEEEDTHQHRHHGRQSRVSGSRRTRSQVAPDWTAKDSLILVNEIAAVEGDCRGTLSTFQKWKIIVGNCNALEVNRTLNQCRRQWDSLLTDYRKMKQLGSSESYWSLDADKRRELGVPEDFDPDVFKAMEDHLEADDGSETEPEDDPDAVNEEEEVDVMVESDFENRRGQVRHLKWRREGSAESEEDSPNKEVMPEPDRTEVKAKTPKRKSEKTKVHKKRNKEEQERIITEKLQEHADMLNAILKEANVSDDADCVLADLKKQNEADKVNLARQQAERLISCLGNARAAIDELSRIYREDGN